MRQSYDTLETSRLILKPFSEADIESYQKHINNYEVIRYLSTAVPWPYPEDGAQSFYEMIKGELGGDRWLWCIHLKDRPEAGAIGAVDLWTKREGKPENRGFWLGQNFWGNGYMTEATDVVTDYAFDHLGFEKLVLCNAVGNQRSARVKEKAGAIWLRAEACDDFVDSSFTEHEFWELTKENWKARKVA